jgi:hypothetical protein
MLLLIPLTGWADSMPIRGATGGGYGQFQWGTSLATVKSLSPKLIRIKTAKECVEEEKYLKGLARAKRANRRKKKPWPSGIPGQTSLARYHHWVTINGMRGRTEYAFYRDQLFEVVVRLVYRQSQMNQKSKILNRLVQKYGPPKPQKNGDDTPLSASHIVFSKMGGVVTTDQLNPGKKQGFLRLVYRDRRLHDAALEHLDQLQETWARFAPKKKRRLPRKKRTRPRDSIDQHI